MSALQATDETPPVASVSLAPDFYGYLFAITMDRSWNEALCPLVRPPTALATRGANTTPMSHGLSVFCLIDSGSAVTGCWRDWCPNVPENQTRVHCGEKDVLFTIAGRQSKGFNFQVSRTTETRLWNCDNRAFIIALLSGQRMGDRTQP